MGGLSPVWGQESTQGDWNVNASGNWGTAANWTNLDAGTSYPSGIDAVANLINQISGTTTVTLNVPVTLGTLNIGDLSGGHSFKTSGGTLTFDVSSGNAQLNMVNDGGNITIDSTVVLNDTLDITLDDPSNNQGISLTGAITGGMGAGNVSMTINDISYDYRVNWVLINDASNTFTGQVVVESGLLRYESSNNAAGARGVGNETIVLDGGTVDIRDRDFNVQADDTEIFHISGSGTNGVGALRNTAGTGAISHLVLDNDATIGGYSSAGFMRHFSADGTSQIAPIVDLGGHALTKLGTNEWRFHNADIQNRAGAVINIYEGEIKFENDGALVGGALIDGTTYGNNLDGLVINVMYNKNPYDGVDPLNGSRSIDPYNPPSNHTVLTGNTISDPRLSFNTSWPTSGIVHTHPANTKITNVYDNFTVNMSNGVWQREGGSSAGQTFDQIFGPNVTINFVGGGVGPDDVGSGNLFDLSGGSANYNATLDVFDHPGVTEIQGTFDNTSPGNEGTGFTARGNRELRVTGDNSTSFDGDILILRPTGRVVSNSTTTSGSAPPSSEFTNMSLAGANGNFSGANSITLSRWGSLALLNNSANAVYASVNNNNRLNDNGTLILRDGYLKIETDVAVTNTENLGHVIADAGTNYLYLDTRAGGLFDGSMESFTSNANGVLKVYVTNPSQTFGTAPGSTRLYVADTSGITTVGTGAAGTSSAAVARGIFGQVLPTLATPNISGSYTRSLVTVQGSYMQSGGGMTLMTLDNGYLRPLTASEFSTSATPVTGTNWLINGYINPVSGAENYGDLNNYAARNVTDDATVNSLSITFDSAASGDAIPASTKDYVIIGRGKTLTISSGIINYNSYAEATAANMESVIRGGSLDMNGQVAIINSNALWQDLDRNTGNWYELMTANSGFIRSSITNAAGLIKTGRSNLYLETANDISGLIWTGEQGALVARHPLALGLGAPGREVRITGGGAFLIEYGTNITGIDVRVTNSIQGSATVLRAEGTTHSTWGGDVILDVADAHGTAEFQSYTITARNNGVLTLYGNVYTVNNDALSDSDSFNDPPLVTTNIGETYTVNFRGQFRDLAGGNLANPIDGNPNITSVYRTGDSDTRLDANHSLRFQMTGHDEGNVNVFQQWDATGRIDLRQGYFRVMYDPASADGFYTDGARALLANDYMSRVVLGADGTSTSNAYHAHLMLTEDGQVFNAPYIYAYNDNRNGTLTIGGENESGTVYYGSNNNATSFSLQIANQSSERDVRFLQVRGGTLVFNGRLDDENSTVTSFNSSVSIVGPGTVVFNRNSAGSSDIDRWNFLAGETHWGTMTGNNQFATTDSSVNAGVSGWGGGGLVLDAQGTMRTQTLNGNIWMMGGSSYANVNQNTTLTLGSSTSSLNRATGSTLAFLEDGNGVINISASGLTTTDGEFLGTWGVYGSAAGGVTDWAARAGTTGVQAFASYTNDAFGTGLHTNLTTSPAALGADAVAATVRFEGAAALDLGGFGLTLEQGGLLVPATNAGDISITNGILTSGWTAGSNDLVLQNFGSGTATIGAAITNNGTTKVNLVNAGSGTTVLAGSNTYTGDTYLNGGVLEISSDANLGVVNGSIAKIVRVNIGSTNGSNITDGRALVFGTANAPDTAASGTYNTNSSQQITSLSLTDGGSGYTSGIYVSTDVDQDGTVANNGNGGIRAILDSGNLHFDGGTLRVRDTMTLNGARTIFIGGNGATLMVDAGETLTIDGYISSEFSHAITANGYSLINQIGTDWQPASDRNPDIGDLIIAGGGTVKLTGAPDGTVRGNQQNSYGGITWINDGVLQIASAGSSADGILGTNRSWVDGTIIGANGTLLFNTTSDVTFREWTTFRGQGYQGRGTIQTMGTARTYRLAGQLYLEEDVVLNMKNASNIRFNEGGGTMYGSADIYRSGNGTLAFYGNAPDWTGRLFNSSDSVYVTSAGNLSGLSEMTLTRNTYFALSAGSTSVNEFRDRLPDDLPVFTDGYVRMRLDATGGVYAGEEKLGSATVQGGLLGLEFNLAADLVGGVPRLQGDYAVWHFGEIVRGAGATVHLRSLDAGTEFAGADFLTTQFENVAGVRVDILPAMTGAGDGTNGNASVVTGFFGGVRPAWVNAAGTGNIYNEDFTSTRLVTVATTPGGDHYLRPLMDSEYRTIASDDTAQITGMDLGTLGITADQNLRIVGVTTDTGIGLGELDNRRDSLLYLGATDTLTVNSLTFESTSYVGGSTSGWGNFTALAMKASDTIVINSGMVVYANTGIYNRAGASHDNGRNLDIRSALNGGRLDFNSQDAIFNIAGRWVHYNTSDSPDAYKETDGDNTLLYLNSTIQNAGDLIKTGGGSLFVQSANEYTGDTYVTQGVLYLRNDRALGAGDYVYVRGAGNLAVGHGTNITGKTVVVGAISGNNLGMVLQEGAGWGGDIIIDNIDAAGSTSFTRNFTPRIYQDQSYRSAITGDIYGGSTPIGSSGLTDSRMFSTYDSSNGILDLRGMVRDTASGAIAGPITQANQNQVLRMELVATNNENTVQVWNSYDAAGRIRLLQANLVYQGTGNFYSDAAAAAIESAIGNSMVGFQMGGRSVMSSDGSGSDDLAFFLANSGSVFNLSSWEVGVETTDPDNLAGHDNFNRGNITGNSTLGGLNTSGSVSFGTGEGAIVFTNMTRFSAYDRDLRLSAAIGGTVNIDAALVDGGSGVDSSITKVGGGVVNLNGSSIGAGTVEAVNVLGGMLVLGNYDVHADRRIGAGAGLLLGGGTLVMDGSGAAFTESFGSLTLRTGGGALAAIGGGTLQIGGSAISRAAGTTLHFQSIGGGVVNFSNGAMASLARLGSYATFGANGANSAFATDWAATDAAGNVIAFTGYGADTFGASTHTDVQTALQLAGDTSTASLRFDSASGTIDAAAAQILTLTDGGVLITSNHTGGAILGANVSLTTGGAGTDLIIHNYASAPIVLDAAVTGAQNVVFTGVGSLTLAGASTYSGDTFVNGQAAVAFDDISRFGSTGTFRLNGGTLDYAPSAASTTLLQQNIVLGGNDGVIRVSDADSILILRGAASNQITGEANPVASIASGNPFSGGLTLVGSGTIQFGRRSTDGTEATATAADTTDLLGLVNNYTGLTIIGDGVDGIRVVIQGQGGDNAQYTPFGTTYSWADGTILRNNATIEFAARRGDSNRDGQYRFREWFQVGEQAGDQITFEMTTYRQATLDGQINLIGDLTINSQNAKYDDAGNNVNNTDILFNPNEGGLYGSGNIIKIGDGNVRFYQSLREWTGDLDIRDGFVGLQSYQTSMFEPTGKIYMGDPTGATTSLVRFRVEGRYGNSATSLDSGFQNIEVSRDIIVRDNLHQEIRLELGYSAETYLTYSGNLHVGSNNGYNNSTDGSLRQVMLYQEDTTGLDPDLVGHTQHSVMAFTGNITGSNNIMILANEGGSVNDTDTNSDITLTVFLSGDNSGFTGQWTIGQDVSTIVDMDDAQILRLGSVNALLDNQVNFRNRGTLQLGGISKTFTQNLLYIGGVGTQTSAGIENASDVATTITFDSGTKAGPTYQDIGVGLRDGVAQPIFGGGNAALSVVKTGAGETVFGASTGGADVPDSFSNYTGTTQVQQGTLILGSNNSFSPNSRFIVSDGATLSFYWDNAGIGFDSFIGSLAGTSGSFVNIQDSYMRLGGDSTRDADYAGTITGTGTVLMSGGGAQRLSGNNIFSGDLAVVQGTLIGATNTAFGDSANLIYLGGLTFVTQNPIDARVELLLSGTATAVDNDVQMNESDGNDEGITIIGTRDASGSYGFTAEADIDAYQNFFALANGSSVFSFGGVISNSGSLTKVGQGTVELHGANTYGPEGVAGAAIDGGTVLRHGTLAVFDDDALSSTVVEMGDVRIDLADVYVATTSPLLGAAAASYDLGGTGSFLKISNVIDGVTLTAADIGRRILVKDEFEHPEWNGIYEIVSVDAATGQMNLVRSSDFDESAEMLYGSNVAVTNGAQAGQEYFMASRDVTTVNGEDYEPVYWERDYATSDISLLLASSGLSILNNIDINDTNGGGTTTIGGSFSSGTSTIGGDITLQHNDLPNVDNVRELVITSASNDDDGSGGRGVILSGVISESTPGDILHVTKAGSGTVTFTNENLYTGKTTVAEGTLALSGDGALPATSWVEVAGGATFDFATTNAGDFTFDGPISGAGTVVTGAGSLVVGTDGGAGVLSPGMSSEFFNPATAGDGIGVFTVDGNLVLTGSSVPADRLTLQMGATGGADYNDAGNFTTQLAGGSAAFNSWLGTQSSFYDSQTGGNHDRVVVTGDFSMDAGGLIRFSGDSGSYQPTFGDVFNLMDWASANPNSFDAGGAWRTGGLLGDLELPDLGASGLLYDTSLFFSHGIVVVVPEPGRAALALLGLSALLLRRRRTHGRL